ncbi:TPA: acyl-homoserine-lactone synthase LasI, partial [Pseudomonas aeruginosa]
APCSPHIWELSRFAINSGQKGSLGFSDCTLEAMRALARYSLQNDIQTLVTVTTVGVEKMMIRAGLDVSRFGPHLKIGIERAVALRIELNAKTQIALYGGVLVEQRLAVS